jgi:hypothetical protein
LLGSAAVPPDAPVAPVTVAVPAVIVVRRNSTLADPVTNTATLEAPAVVAFCAWNPKSSNVTPVANPVTSSAYPAAEDATTAGLVASYVHCAAEQFVSPPYTESPSTDTPTTRFSV